MSNANTNFDTTLERINRQTEENETRALAARIGMSYAMLDEFPFSLEALVLVPLETVTDRRYAPYVKTTNRLRVALEHPEDSLVVDDITLLARKLGVEIELTVVSGDSFDCLIAAYKRLLTEREAAKAAELEHTRALAEKDYLHKVRTLENLQNEIASVSVTEVIDVIVAAAYNQNASDIHFEPEQDGVTVRFRIDGVLRPVLHLPSDHLHQLVSRIKMLSGIKLDRSVAALDGRFSVRDKGIDADIRVSMVPTGYGEGIVMRILRQDTKAVSLSDLGFSAHNLGLIERAIKRPYGMILVTGPTGSGKSTTLYSILQKLNSPEKKIITLEDPIEYRIEGVQQSQIDPDHGFNFAEGLKGALRQDPDIIMVGEIRDPETATIALNASLTGHLVLSTIHTNDAVSAHARFLELGVEPFLLSGSIQAIIAQRLVRVPVAGSDPANPEYAGRIVIAEVLVPNPDFERAVISHADSDTLQRLAREGGMVPMLEDGMQKIKDGRTTEAEVYRVTAA
jgi:type IV pilus assembly protein PilB